MPIKYHQDITLNFLFRDLPDLTQYRHSKSARRALIINDPSNTQLMTSATLANLQAPSRIYIDAHGNNSPDSKTAYRLTGSDHDYTLDELVDLLSALPRSKAQDQELSTPRITISLVCCYSGMKRNNRHAESLAAKLLIALGQKGIYVNIKARSDEVATSFFKKTKKTVITEKQAQLLKYEQQISKLQDKIKILKAAKKSTQHIQQIQELIKAIEKHIEKHYLAHHQAGSKILFI